MHHIWICGKGYPKIDLNNSFVANVCGKGGIATKFPYVTRYLASPLGSMTCAQDTTYSEYARCHMFSPRQQIYQV